MLFMGVDVGTQGVRCVVADECGALIASKSVPFQRINIAETPLAGTVPSGLAGCGGIRHFRLHGAAAPRRASC